MAKDYYSILGIDRKANADEIKQAFRKLAHKYHPDKQGGNEQKFKEISEAYSVLSNEKKRAEYDAYGRVFGDGSGGGQSTGGWDFGGNAEDFQNFDFSDIFGDFGDIFGGTSRGEHVRRGRDIAIDVQISFRESVFGTERKVLLTKTALCQSCGGNGAKVGTEHITCTTCNGKGKLHETRGSILGTFTSVRTCSVCLGKGKTPKERCSGCSGAGVVRREEEITVNIPTGIASGEMIRMTGAGEAVAGGSSGDLYVKVHVEKDSIFSKEGADLYMSLPLKLSDAILGGDNVIQTLDGNITIKIPSGISHGELLRVKGKGVPIKGRRGDLFVRISITLPKKISSKARKLIEELKNEGI